MVQTRDKREVARCNQISKSTPSDTDLWSWERYKQQNVENWRAGVNIRSADCVSRRIRHFSSQEMRGVRRQELGAGTAGSFIGQCGQGRRSAGCRSPGLDEVLYCTVLYYSYSRQ
jgi:hypothetical protein